ncbi:MAG TPA: response regulator [Verrucomicrobiota bacterium]|jgi:DNA-binding response OmpR family regulator|nr:response regulator [Verrucomicrobiota bacterium]HRT06953.1 response regulator [Candidatus Paceibacterota bacterium]
MAKKVLFVDADAAWRDAVSACFAEAGQRVITAQNATEALELAGRDELSLIILELDLAGENGLNLLKFLKHNAPAVPVVVFTHLSHDEAGVRAILNAGADQYLQKESVESLLVTAGAYFQ